MNAVTNDSNAGRSWGKYANDLVHEPVVDMAIGAVGATAIIASRGKLAGLVEKCFPSAASLLGGVEDTSALSPEMRGIIMSKSCGELFGVATQEKTSPQVLSLLGDHFDPSVLAQVAKNPSTPVETLEKLAIDGKFASEIARNKSVTPLLLDRLSFHAPEVVAGNAKTTTRTLDNLALRMSAEGKRGSSLLIRNLFVNPNTSSMAHRIITSPQIDDEALRLAKSPRTAPEVLAELSAGASRFSKTELATALAKNENTPLAGLMNLSAMGKSGEVATAVRLHPNADELLRK
jgi:hypothetical protein